MRWISCWLSAWLLMVAGFAHAERITIAAASDLKFALDEIVAAFHAAYPADEVSVVYGSSGNFYAQIRQGAPYDLYFSADIAYPRMLQESGGTASEVIPYALGRIVLWSLGPDAAQIRLEDLADSRFTRIAIANPRHAPYGKRAEEALRASGVWEQVKPRLVYGENIAQTLQFVQTGNAQIGIVALSLVLGSEPMRRGSYQLIPAELHEPLEQGFVILRRAAGNALAPRFAQYMQGQAAREVLDRYGFVLPEIPGVDANAHAR